MKKFRTPKISYEHVVSFTCSDTLVNRIVSMLERFHDLGQAGCTIEITFYFDGDGTDKIDNICVNGVSLREWELEKVRLAVEGKWKRKF